MSLSKSSSLGPRRSAASPQVAAPAPSVEATFVDPSADLTKMTTLIHTPLHRNFKATVAKEGTTMRDVVEELIEKWIDDHK